MNGSFLLNICFLYFTTVLLCNSLTPKSGWRPISPHIITPNISPLQCQNKGNDPQLKMLLTGQQIFLVRSLGNVWKTVWRTCILTLRCKGVWNTLFNTFPYLQQWQPLNLRQPVKTSLKCKSWLSLGLSKRWSQSFPAIPSRRGLDHMWSLVTPLIVWRKSCFNVISQVITEIYVPWLVEDCVISRYNLLVWGDYCRGVFITNKAE